MRIATQRGYQELVQVAIEKMATHLDESLDFRELAEEACMSPFHFHRVFRGMVGETPGELLRRLRLERAAHDLRETEKSILEIALDAGYETHEAFTRTFRTVFATTPSAFRSKSFALTNLAGRCGIHFSLHRVVPLFIPQNSGGKNMNVVFTEMPSMRIATVHHTGPYNQITDAFCRLGALGGPAGLFNHPEAKGLAIYYDDPESTPPSELKSDAGVVVAADAEIPPGLNEQHIPAGRFARTTHIGPYEQLGDVWARFLGEWLPASGNKMRGDVAGFEIYLNHPGQVPPEQLHTDLYIPIE